MKKNIKFAGFGGQGIIIMGHIIGNAFSIQAGKHASLTQSYGPEARGGACSTDLVVSGSNVNYPHFELSDILVVMSREAFNVYGKNVLPGGIIITDSDMVSIDSSVLPKNVQVYDIPATKLAEDLGKKIVANIVMLGYFVKVTKMINPEHVKKAIFEYVPKGTEKLNQKAFETGYNYRINRRKLK